MTADNLTVADEVATVLDGGPNVLGLQGPGTLSPASLIGRAAELDLVRRFVSGAAHSGGALLLCGDAGVGKTALLGAAAAAARADQLTVLSTAGVDVLPDIAYSALAQALRSLRPVAARLGPAQREALDPVFGDDGHGDGANPDPMPVLRAALSLLHASAVDGPVLLIVDDLQRIDAPSAVAFAFAARRLGGSRVAFLAAARTGGTDLVDRAQLPEHQVAPLDDLAAARLLRVRFPRLAPMVARRVLAEAAGNPRALAELPAALTEPERTGRRPLPEVLPIGPRLRELYGPRTTQLPAAARWLLLLTALEATGDMGVVAAVCGTAGLEDLAPAERAGLIQLDRGARRVVFGHPLVRSTIVDLASPSERQRAHRALAEQLVGDPDRRARHLADAATGQHERIAQLVEAAARSALRGGDAVGALSGWWRAVDLTPDGAEQCRRLAQAAHVGAAVTGDIARVGPLLAEARGSDPAGPVFPPTVVASAWMLLHTDGEVGATRQLLAEAAAASWAGVRDEVVGDAMHVAFEVSLDAGIPELWDDLTDLMDRLRYDSPELRLLVEVLADPPRASAPVVARLDRMITTLGTETDPTRIVRIATAAVAVDRGSGCRSALRRVVDSGRQGGAVTSAIRALALLCTDAFLTGRWNECLQVADEGVELCANHGYRLLAGPLRRVQARVVAARGDRDAAAALALGAATRGAPLAATSSRFAMVAAGCAAVAASPDGAARELFEEALATPEGERWAFDHARIQLAYGRHLRRHREAAPARWHLHAALATFQRLAADPWAAQARDELRAVGARTADARASTVPLRPTLSPQEREVAGLAASGLTNKQIAVRLHLSPRTVSARLYQIFPKLGVTSRAGLRDALSGLATSAAGTAP